MLPHETSFSRTTLTHLPLLHWVSFEQKQPPEVAHWFDAPLHVPNVGQEYPVAVEFGHPPSGQGIPESPASPAPSGVQTPPEHARPPAQANDAPQPPQLEVSFMKSAQPPPQAV